MPNAILDNRFEEKDQFLNPKQEAFLKYYLDPQSDTFSNITQSGIKAGFSATYSANLVTQMPSWLADTMGDARRLRTAEDNLTQLLEQNDDIKVKADITKFVASTMGRKKYSTRTETDVTSQGQAITGINYIVPKEATVLEEPKTTDAEIVE